MRMKRTVCYVLGIGGLLLPVQSTRADNPSPKPDSTRSAADRTDADNTGRNVRDRTEGAVTPMDQGTSESDRMITQEIRKSVVARDDFSTNARNVKIITRDGVVTLRGPVKSIAEHDAIASSAAKAPGVKRVDDQIEVERER